MKCINPSHWYVSMKCAPIRCLMINLNEMDSVYGWCVWAICMHEMTQWHVWICINDMSQWNVWIMCMDDVSEWYVYMKWINEMFQSVSLIRLNKMRADTMSQWYESMKWIPLHIIETFHGFISFIHILETYYWCISWNAMHSYNVSTKCMNDVYEWCVWVMCMHEMIQWNISICLTVIALWNAPIISLNDVYQRNESMKCLNNVCH